MNLNPLALSNYVMIAIAFVGAFLVALWLSLVIWAARDIRRRARDPLVRILAVLVAMILFLPGILIYLILRPPRTIEEEYQQTLEEEALLQSIEDKPLCPGCGRQIQVDWVACPSCNTRLKKPCHHCGKLMELPWNLCPYCGTPAPGMRVENQTMDDVLRVLPTEPTPESISSPTSDQPAPQENQTSEPEPITIPLEENGPQTENPI